MNSQPTNHTRGLIGTKVGMTQVFSETGQAVPVTIIAVGSNYVLKTFTKGKDGYSATQITTCPFKTKRVKAKKISKPLLGHFKKHKVLPCRHVKEIRGMTGYLSGDKINVSLFKNGEYVNVTSYSKGKGFAGAIKRHNQHIGPMSHGGGGGSKPRRLTGSIGTLQNKRVFKGMTMPGQMGGLKTTVKNLKVIIADEENNFIAVKGSIPGSTKSTIIIRNAPQKTGVVKPFKMWHPKPTPQEAKPTPQEAKPTPQEAKPAPQMVSPEPNDVKLVASSSSKTNNKVASSPVPPDVPPVKKESGKEVKHSDKGDK